MEFLEFELPIKEIIDKIDKYKSKKNEAALNKSSKYKLLQKKLEETKKIVYGNLTPWQKVQLSRHPNRPYTLDYINNILAMYLIDYSIFTNLIIFSGNNIAT